MLAPAAAWWPCLRIPLRMLMICSFMYLTVIWESSLLFDFFLFVFSTFWIDPTIGWFCLSEGSRLAIKSVDPRKFWWMKLSRFLTC